jgi:hypothetical protein
MNRINKPILQHKAQLVRRAVERFKVSTIADLGGCWGVNGGYTFDALSHADIKRAVIVDGFITDITKKRAQNYQNINLIEGSLGSDVTHARVGNVDAVIMFDILLHQANPDWDKFLIKYCNSSNILIIYNQNWLMDKKTIRFLELGVDKYLELVPHSNAENVKKWFQSHLEYNEEQDCLNKNIHNFWQYGITTPDMINLIYEQGFNIDYLENFGIWDNEHTYIHNIGIIAVKHQLITSAPKA